MDLKEVMIFTQVVRSGSFTAAARELGIQKSSASRKVADLEQRLGARLLQRTTRSLRLTDEGRVFYEHCQRAVAALEEAELALSGMRATPTGRLRVTAPISFSFLGPLFGTFLERYPEVQIELVCTDRVVDLVEEGFDLAIRVGRLPDTSLIARRLGTLPHHLFASPAYLERRGSPGDPADLEAHDCLAFGTVAPSWRLVSAGRSVLFKPGGRFLVNDYDLLREATIAGAGIALLPEPGCAHAVREGALARVLPAWTAAESPIHAVYPSTRHLAAKVKAFVEHLQAGMRTEE